MRKAKVAALIFGGVSTCIFGGLLGVYATAPVVSSVSPKNDVENIYEVDSENLANVAAVTSIRTTTVTTTSKSNIKNSATTITTMAVDTAETNANTSTVSESVFTAPSVDIASDAPEAEEAPDEAPTESFWEQVFEATEPATEAPTEYVEPATEAPTEPDDSWNAVQEPASPETPAETPAVDTDDQLPISDEDFIILCNAVAHEAGCNWISEYDKAKVVEVIMNRVYSPLYPNTITGVLTQRGQFSGSTSYVYLGTYTNYVTESVKNSVKLYFNEPDSFAHGYFGFFGDGYQNYFY